MKESSRAVVKPPQEFALGEVLDFLRLLWAVDHALQRKSKRMEATLGVTGPQRLVIRIVGRFPGMVAGDLARALHVHPSTLTGVLQRLEGRGLIRRRSDPDDARRSLLWLTAKGSKFDVEIEGTVEAATSGALASFSPEVLRDTRGVLQSIADALEQSAHDEQPASSKPRKAAPANRPRRAR